MLSMSNQFYDYISDLLVDFFKNIDLKKGDRFYLQLDNEQEVLSLVESMSNHITGVKPFPFKHELGEEYETFYIPFGNLKLVVAHTSPTVKPDFLVLLRNQVGEQNGVWADTALISIVSEQLDSIQGGSSDLQKEGMPLHPNSIYQRLKKEIENTTLPKVDQIILQDNLDNLMKDQFYQRITIFDFEEIFITLEKGSIDSHDYYKFGLFKDPELGTFNGKDQKLRLKDNRELFDFISRVHDFGLEEEELHKRFLPDGAKELFKKEWKDTIFSRVFKLHEEFKKSNKKKKVELSEIKSTNKLELWNKPHNENTAGMRKRHLVIFNPDGLNQVELQLSFSFSGNIKSLSADYLTIGKQFQQSVEADVKNTNIFLKFDCTKELPTFCKVNYKHDKKATLGVELNIVIIPILSSVIAGYKSKYMVEPLKKSIVIQTEDDAMIFGTGSVITNREVNGDEKDFVLSDDQKLKLTILPEAFNDDNELMINLRFEEAVIPFLFRNESQDSFPISGFRIWKLLRETGKNFKWIKENNRLILDSREFYFHPEYKQYFNWESHWLEEGLRSATVDSEQLLAREIDLSEDLRESYSRFMTYFKINQSIPSLCTITEEYKDRALAYLNDYVKEIQQFEEGIPAGKKGRDLFKLGTIESSGILYVTPFHPVMVAFKLKLYEQLGSEEVDNSILNRITPNALFPYVYNDAELLFKPDFQQAAMDWTILKPVNKITVSDANQYLARVVNDKITQFKGHFSYLFMPESKAALKLNVINIANDHEVIRGIFQWMQKEIEQTGIEALKPVEVTLYNTDENGSSFDLYSKVQSVAEFEEVFNMKLKTKNVDAEDVLRTFREKLFFYTQILEEDMQYAHISFYKMQAQEHHAVQPMKDMVTGINLEGLYSSVPSMKDAEIYRSGFGIKGYGLEEDMGLINVVYHFNELAANLRNGGNDSFHKGEAILSRTTNTDEEVMRKVFRSSSWVTFVDPSVDLEFFNNLDENLIVIHYSDQYSSSSRYDAITVTEKSDQYYAVIKEFLEQKEVSGSIINVQNTIKAFNMFNGEWLLRIIGSKGHYDREKLSIISAIKYAVSYFDHKDITWFPISLEEILRVAGAVSLNKSDGIFTSKNLGISGSQSDDLLLIGLENTEGQISLYYYPVEVKIGHNKGNIIEKAKKQVLKTKGTFIEAMTGENCKDFTAKFYRNFFVQLLLSTAKKLEQSDFWKEKNYHISDQVIEKLLKDDYVISDKLSPYIGEGAVLSFQKDAVFRSAEYNDGVLLLNLTEMDGYSGLVKPVDQMWKWIQKDTNDFVKEDMLSHAYNAVNVTPDQEEIVTTDSMETYGINSGVQQYKEEISEIGDINDIHGQNEHDISEQIAVNKPSVEIETSSTIDGIEEKPLLEDIRIKIGKADNSNRDIYWEYGHKGLANRHLLISGKSGQGKTYFMQCLLLEKSRMGISSIVIDYTEGFLPNQLEPEFVSYMGNKLKHKIVYSEKLPINPFSRNVRDIGGIELPESNTDIAERIKSVFAAVYKSLGIQQQNAIYEAILTGLDRYDSQMDLIKLKVLLEEDGSSYSKTALSQIRPLIDRNPFNKDNTVDWKDVINSKGEVFIIQLTGFPRDVQLMITEFILWDLWNHSVKHGNKNKPMPVIMDEAQNLDHTEKSPSARILTEGRKFGWSAWYATQFLKSQLDADELARLQNSSQKVYFSPPEQELSNIASSLSKDPHEKKVWEQKLGSLKKGQCIVQGPIRLDNGELSNPTAIVVNIAPLSERI